MPLRVALVAIAAAVGISASTVQPRARAVHFVFTSDAHYGLHRAAFRGRTNVDARVVNQALVAAIKTLPNVRFPSDGGVQAGERVSSIDFVAEGGDIANRAELGGEGAIQPASASWAQFEADYVNSLAVPVYMIPGNHDASNAVGYYTPMTVDASAIAGIFNRMMHPNVPRTPATFDYAADRVIFSNDYGGVHFVYVAVWVDSRARAWIDADLQRVPASTPVAIVTHDQPEADSKHFVNPHGHHDVNAADRFENLLADEFADGDVSEPTLVEQRALEQFLVRHRNVVAYFHGNSNWNDFYEWRGPDGSAALRVFRVDSPIKGKLSITDERKLSFHVATIDATTQRMTVRECLWNADPAHPGTPVVWGAAATVSPRGVQNRTAP